jgi:hypothetical protein
MPVVCRGPLQQIEIEAVQNRWIIENALRAFESLRRQVAGCRDFHYQAATRTTTERDKQAGTGS